MVKEPISGIIHSINSIPTEKGPKKLRSAAEIMENRNNQDANVKRINYGDYSLVHT